MEVESKQLGQVGEGGTAAKPVTRRQSPVQDSRSALRVPGDQLSQEQAQPEETPRGSKRRAQLAMARIQATSKNKFQPYLPRSLARLPNHRRQF